MRMATSLPETVSAPTECILAEPSAGGLLRFSTAGSVDDGKSTLIGRLLYESQGVYEDQLESVRKSRVNRSGGPIDFALLTDGLRAEREQGITIDVAYRYFSTPRRRFIVADTPGHEPYTRNMATGASTADATVVLMDATKGLLRQSRRHAYIVSLLGVQQIAAAVNKMDLVGYSRDIFEHIEDEFSELARQLGMSAVYAVPVSALHGDNVVRRSAQMQWFDGPPLLEYLETVPIPDHQAFGALRFPVQCVIRPDANFRGFAGQVASGVLRRGAKVVALPSNVRTRIRSIVTFDGEWEAAPTGNSVTVTLEDEIDLSRGDMLAAEEEPPVAADSFRATLVWMHAECLDLSKNYLLKQTSRTVRARVRQLYHCMDVYTLEKNAAATLNMNEIGEALVHTSLPIFFDAYSRNRKTGSFILIDPLSNATVAAGVVEGPRADMTMTGQKLIHSFSSDVHRVTWFEKQSKAGNRAITVWIESDKEVAYLLERVLFDSNCRVHALASDTEPHIAEICRALNDAGVIAIHQSSNEKALQRTRELIGDRNFVFIRVREDNSTAEHTANFIHQFLIQRGFL